MQPILAHATMGLSLGGLHHLLVGRNPRDRRLPRCEGEPEALRAWHTGHQALRVWQTGYQVLRAWQTGYQALRTWQTG